MLKLQTNERNDVYTFFARRDVRKLGSYFIVQSKRKRIPSEIPIHKVESFRHA